MWVRMRCKLGQVWMQHPPAHMRTGGRLGGARLQHPLANAEVRWAMPDWAAMPTGTCKGQDKV